MIHHEQNDSQIVKTIWYYQNMQYEVDPMNQTREIDPELNVSFKNSTRRTPKILKTQREFSWTCGFRRVARK